MKEIWLSAAASFLKPYQGARRELQLDKLAAIDLHPILPLGKNADSTIVADAILGGDHVLDDDLLQSSFSERKEEMDCPRYVIELQYHSSTTAGSLHHSWTTAAPLHHHCCTTAEPQLDPSSTTAGPTATDLHT
ncbi:unnamed protein product [Leuciscus chuanchicus]